jgi:hypothetical protein
VRFLPVVRLVVSESSGGAGKDPVPFSHAEEVESGALKVVVVKAPSTHLQKERARDGLT